MERNFMGLAQKKVKEEVIDICDDPASAMQWSFSSQVSHSQSSSLKAGQEDRPRKTGYDSLTSTGYMTISTPEALNSNQKSYSNMMQRNTSLEKHVGSHYPVANYPSQHFDAHAVQHPHEARLLSNTNRTNQIVPASMSIPVHQPIITSVRPNVITTPVNLQSVEGVPIVAPAAVGPSSTSIVGNTDLRNATKILKAPAQLTIFYSGLVCVYDNVSPEKAQAIMLLAGNPPSMTPNTAVPAPSQVQAPIPRLSMTPNAAVPIPSQVQAPIPRPSSVDSFVINQSQCIAPGVGLLGHISITSTASAQSAGLSSTTNEITARKPVGVSISHSTVPEPLRIVSSLRHASAIQPILNSSAVPQARKASLARFLEKRKERAMVAAPYNTTQSPECSALGQGSKSFSMNSASSSPLPTIITLQ